VIAAEHAPGDVRWFLARWTGLLTGCGVDRSVTEAEYSSEPDCTPRSAATVFSARRRRSSTDVWVSRPCDRSRRPAVIPIGIATARAGTGDRVMSAANTHPVKYTPSITPNQSPVRLPIWLPTRAAPERIMTVASSATMNATSSLRVPSSWIVVITTTPGVKSTTVELTGVTTKSVVAPNAKRPGDSEDPDQQRRPTFEAGRCGEPCGFDVHKLVLSTHPTPGDDT